jgi:hypothetical protein
VRQIVDDETRSPTKYTVIGKKDWLPSNVLLDFESPYREDYTLFANESGFLLDTTKVEYLILDEAGDPILDESESPIYDERTGTDTSSARINHKQDYRHGIRNVRRGRYMQVRVVNKRGASELIFVKSISKPIGRSSISKQTT